jgi:tetratricopeptide (TPR) repeat protein
MALGFLASAQGDYARATAFIAESASLASDPTRDAPTLQALAGLAAEQGDDARALALARRSADLYREADDVSGLVAALDLLAQVALRQGGPERAAALYTEAVIHLRDVEHPRATVACLEGLGCVLVATGHAERAVRLFAAAAQVREAEQMPRRSARDAAWHDHYVAVARHHLAAEAWDRAWQAGVVMTREQALALAIGGEGTDAPVRA